MLPFIIIALPLLICFVYYLLFAVDRFESSTKVVVRHAGAEQAQQSAGLAILFSGLNPASREETLYFAQYVLSVDMMRKLDAELGWSRHYSGQTKDPIYWLASDASEEDKFSFYERVINTFYDETTGLLQIRVEALTPEFAEEVLRYILKDGEEFVNELSHRMGRDQMKFAQSELNNARVNYEAQRDRLLKFQQENGMLNADSTATSRNQLLASLEVQLATERAELRSLSSSLSSASPQVRQKVARVDSIQRQIDIETSRLVKQQSGGEQFNVAAAEFRNLTLDAGIAEEIYKLSVNAVEAARIEANKKIRSLMVIVAPNMPEDAIYPKRIYNLATIFMFLLLGYGIVRFVLATVEDHRD